MKTQTTQKTLISVEQDWLIAFEADLLLQGRSERTVKAYRLDVRSFASWCEQANEQAFTLACFNRADLQAFAKQQHYGAEVKPATWNRRLASLRVFARWLQETGRIEYDPTDVLQKLEETQLAPQWLTEPQYRAVMRQVELNVVSPRPDTPAQRRQAVRDRAIVGLMALAGLRQGEVLELRLDDLILGERKGSLVIRHGKGNKRRHLPFNRELVIYLDEWLAVRGELEHELVFDGKHGELGPDGLGRRIAKLGAAAGIEGLTPHKFRHTYIKRLLDAGVAIQTVAKLAGHDRLETTARYGMPGMADLEAAVEAL